MIQVEKNYQVAYLNINEISKQIIVKVIRTLKTEDEETAKLDDLNIILGSSEYKEFYNTPLSSFPDDATLGEVLEYLVQSRVQVQDKNFTANEEIVNKIAMKGK